MVKAYTDIEQSRKLAEILSADSADMCLTFVGNTWNPVWDKADDIYQFQKDCYQFQKDCYEPDYTKDDYIDIDEFEPQVVPCWSLTALFGVLPMITEDKDIVNPFIAKTADNEYYVTLTKEVYNSGIYDNPIDACYEMILKLHELKLL